MNTDELTFTLAEREGLLNHIETLNETIEIMRKEQENMVNLATTCKVQQIVDLFLNHFNISREDFENNNYEIIEVRDFRCRLFFFI